MSDAALSGARPGPGTACLGCSTGGAVASRWFVTAAWVLASGAAIGTSVDTAAVLDRACAIRSAVLARVLFLRAILASSCFTFLTKSLTSPAL